MESTRRKLEASEEKMFWRQVLLKCWRHQKHLTRSTSHQKHISSEVLKIIISWMNWSFKRLFKGSNHAYRCRRLEGWSNDHFKWIWSHWMLIRWRELKKDNCMNCTTTISTILFCLYNKTRITTMPAPLFLQTWNRFEIDPS